MNERQQGQASSVILVIEDNVAQLDTLTDILTMEGLQPIGCPTGGQALEACQSYNTHVAVLDLRLPDMEGLEVLSQLKQQIPDMKVIINTAHATLESAMEAVNKEAFAYVQKMGDVEELLAHVHRAFHAHFVGYSEQLEAEVRKRTAELVTANKALQQEIAERKRMEVEIRTLNEELELRVRQRTVELEVANRDLQDFAYIVSHDLKTPLRGIRRITEWLLEDYAELFDIKGQEMLDLLTERAQRMDKLIDGVLRYSRVGRNITEEEQIDLNNLVQETITILAPPKHIQIRIANSLPVVTCDRVRIEQVFQNLLSNAITFMDKPQGIITIACKDSGSMWTFTVEDNGPGIDERHHKRIFQIFQTVTPGDEDRNTGVGLTIVKKIVGLYEGTIWVESAPGQGSRFFFTFPKT